MTDFMLASFSKPSWKWIFKFGKKGGRELVDEMMKNEAKPKSHTSALVTHLCFHLSICFRGNNEDGTIL